VSILDRHPDIALAGVEELFFAKNTKTAMMVGQARGVILFTLGSRGIRIEEVKPVEVKAAVAGNGRADKKEMQRIVQLTFHLSAPPQPDDAADAIAIALSVAPRINTQ
jgi:crossover junction endodeoxyribonuclease RuvC